MTRYLFLAPFLIAIFLVKSTPGEIIMPEFNMIELTKKDYHKITSDFYKYVFVELYTSESWCSKYFKLIKII